MSKVYDPIFCMLVDKKVSKASDAVSYLVPVFINDIKSVESDKDFYRVREKINNALVSKIITKEEHRNLIDMLNKKKKRISKDSSVVDRAIRAIDAEKGYELDGFWIKPNDYGVEVTKNGKKVGEFDSTSEAEKWIRGKYGD